jgi:hypothetical protein
LAWKCKISEREIADESRIRADYLPYLCYKYDILKYYDGGAI